MQTQKQGPAPQHLQLNMEGKFRVLTTHDTALRCGPKGSSRLISFNVTIDSRPDLLDEKGFIVDWRDILKVVARRYRNPRHFPSCERLAQEIVRLVGGIMGNRVLGITCRVTIEGLPANMVAVWAPDTEVS